MGQQFVTGDKQGRSEEGASVALSGRGFRFVSNACEMGQREAPRASTSLSQTHALAGCCWRGRGRDVTCVVRKPPVNVWVARPLRSSGHSPPSERHSPCLRPPVTREICSIPRQPPQTDVTLFIPHFPACQKHANHPSCASPSPLPARLSPRLPTPSRHALKIRHRPRPLLMTSSIRAGTLL